MNDRYEELLRLAAEAQAKAAAEPQPEIDSLAVQRNIVEAMQIDVLGEWETGEVEVYSIYHRKTRQIRDMDRVGFNRLLQLCGPPAKHKIHQGQTDVPGMWKLSEAKEAIAVLAGETTLKEDSMRGRGAWRGKGKDGAPVDEIVLVGSGEGAVWNGREFSRVEHPRRGGQILKFTGAGDWYDFGMLNVHLKNSASLSWCQGVVRESTELFEGWRWQNQTAPNLLTGLVMATWLQSIWEWRPQVVITGQTNSGKTYLFQTLERVFGGLALKISGQSTEPGIRQSIAIESPATLLDEWDTGRHQQRILDFVRTSSRSDRRATGTNHQKAVHANAGQIFWLAGIMSGLKKAADLNRFITLELLAPEESSPRLEMRSHDDLADLGQRLLAVAIRHAMSSVKESSRLRLVKFPNMDHRVVESFGVPSSLLACVAGYDSSASEGLLQVLMRNAVVDDESKLSDEEDLLTTITSTVVDGGKSIGKRSVGALIELVQSNNYHTEASEALEQHGIGVSVYTDNDNGETGESCFVLCHNLISRSLLRGTDFEGKTIGQIIKRIYSAEKSRRRIGGVNHRCYLIASGIVESMAIGKKDMDLF